MSNPGKRPATDDEGPNKRIVTDPPTTVEDIVNQLSRVLSGSNKLQQHLADFSRGKFPRDPFPTLADLKSAAYSDVSKSYMVAATSVCAQFMYVGAQATIKEDYAGPQAAIQDNVKLSTAEKLLVKWQRCAHKETPHCGKIMKERSVDDVRRMLASAFADLQACIHIAVMENLVGCAVIKSNPGQVPVCEDWY